jgi:hypothetical protein
LVTEDRVESAIKELISSGLRLEEIKIETLRGRIGGGSYRDLSRHFERFKQRVAKETVLKSAQEANAESLFATASSQVVTLMRELHMAGLGQLNDELTLARSEAASVTAENEELHRANTELNAERNNMAEELAQLRAEQVKAASTIAALTAMNSRLQEQKVALESQNTITAEVAALRKLVEQTQPTAQLERVEAAQPSAKVRSISTAAKAKAARNASKTSKTS